MPQLADADLDHTDTSYAPGQWTFLRSQHSWLLVATDPRSAVAAACAAALSRDGAVDELLSALAAEGFAATPPFALVRLAQDEKRAVVRGGAVVYMMGSMPLSVWAQPGTSWADAPIADDVSELLLSAGPMQHQPPWHPPDPQATGVGAVRLVPSAAPLRPVREPTMVFTEPPDPTEALPTPETAPDTEGGNYNFLWGATQRGITLAALGLEDHDAVASAAEAARAAAAAAGAPHDPTPDPAQPAPAPNPVARTLDDTVQPVQWNTQLPPADGVIDAVPWLNGGPPGDATPTSAPVAQPAAAPVATPVAMPAPEPPMADPPLTPELESLQVETLQVESPQPAAPEIERTVNRAALAAAAAAEAGAVIAGPTVIAAYCPSHHLTPAFAPHCRVCRAPIAPQPGFEIARPTLGILRLSTGDVVTLDRGVVIGRAPEAHAAESPDRPNVLRLQSPHNDLSRNHAEIVLEGWNVYVRDLGSTNGTTVTLPGQSPIRLREHDLFLLEPGAVVNLADEVNIHFEVTA